MEAPPKWLRPVEGGVDLFVRVKPRAARSRVLGEKNDLLEIQLAAPPVDGEANDALVELLSDWLDVPKRQVTLVSGHTSRSKRVRIDGVEVGQIATALAAR